MTGELPWQESAESAAQQRHQRHGSWWQSKPYVTRAAALHSTRDPWKRRLSAARRCAWGRGDRVWEYCVITHFLKACLLLPRAGEPWKRRYIYNQALCGRCGSKVATWEMAARRVYACQTCQPLAESAVISPARSKALAASTPTKVWC